MTAFHPSRRGVTLVEVLIAIGVMGIGMLALLALFPIGALNMQWALNNDRVGMAASNGQAQSELARLNVSPVAGIPIVRTSSDSLRVDSMIDPNGGSVIWKNSNLDNPVNRLAPTLGRREFFWDFNLNRTTFAWMPPLAPGLPANATVVVPPILIDPWVANNAVWKDPGNFATAPIANGIEMPYFVGANDTATAPFANLPLPAISGATRPMRSLGIPRANLASYINNPLVMQSETSLGDEMTFGADGQPGLFVNGVRTATGPLEQDRRFTWAYLCRWPDYRRSNLCDVTTVIFNARPNGGGISAVPPGETSFGSSPVVAAAAGLGIDPHGRVFRKGLTLAAIQLPSGQGAPLKVGDWVFDNTLVLPEYDPANINAGNGLPFLAPFLDVYVDPPVPAYGNLRTGLVGGHFYKVVDISAVRGTAPNLYQVLTLDRPAKSDGFVLTVLSGVADVIEKGMGRMPAH